MSEAGSSLCWIQTMLTAQQMQKHTQSLFSQIYPREAYEQLKQLLYNWKQQHKSSAHTITTFLKILQLVASQAPDLLDDLNRCLAKDYSPSSQPPSPARLKALASEHPHAGPILDTVLSWLRPEPPSNGTLLKPAQLEELSQPEFALRLERHDRCRQISKIIVLYRRCIVTVAEFKKLLEPIYLTDPSFFNMLFQYAEELEERRRRVTIFAPLNELVDQKYPLQQVGNSYIIIPDGYANWGKAWRSNRLQPTLNRICVSVPLGTEGSFVITRKNEFEEQLLRNQEQKYEIDYNCSCLRAGMAIIERTKKLNHPLVLRLISNIYTPEVVGIMMRSTQADVARTIVLPRLRQKLGELSRCRTKFQKQCEQVAGKNFYKSLDYRCFYFCKNDKKFNCPARWEKEIQMRKRQVIEEEVNHAQLQIEDRDSLQHSRHYSLNSYDNITTQSLLEVRNREFGDRQRQSLYPPYPHNQVLFLLDFSDSEVLNDVLEIILYHTQKKSLLELLVFKMMKISIERRLQKGTAVLQFLDGRPGSWDTNDHLNEQKITKRVYKDLTDEFLELIEEDIDPSKLQNQQFSFQGPEEHTLIGTKHCYYFLRYLVTIYQRFLRAKVLSGERGARGEEPSLYVQFLAVLVQKVKEQKGLEEYLRRIFQQDAYIFFTLDKLILGQVKLVNNINADSLTYKILRDDVKDYELQIKRWQDYKHPSVTEQLTRLYRERETLFRFSYSPQEKLIFVSAWENGLTFDADRKKKEGDSPVERNISSFLVDPVYYNRSPSPNCQQQQGSEYLQDEAGNLVMRGEEGLVAKRRSEWDLSTLEKELQRSRKFRGVL